MDRETCREKLPSVIIVACGNTFCPLINSGCKTNCVCLHSDIVAEGSMQGQYKIFILCNKYDRELK